MLCASVGAFVKSLKERLSDHQQNVAADANVSSSADHRFDFLLRCFQESCTLHGPPGFDSDGERIRTERTIVVYVFRVSPMSRQLYVGSTHNIVTRTEEHRQKKQRRELEMLGYLLTSRRNRFVDEDIVVDALRDVMGNDCVTGGRFALHGDGSSSEFLDNIRYNRCIGCGSPHHYVSDCVSSPELSQDELRTLATCDSFAFYSLNAHVLYTFDSDLSTFEDMMHHLAHYLVFVETLERQSPEDIAQFRAMAAFAKRTLPMRPLSCMSFPPAWLTFVNGYDHSPESDIVSFPLPMRLAAAAYMVVFMRSLGRAMYGPGARLANFLIVNANASSGPIVCLEPLQRDALIRFTAQVGARHRLGQPFIGKRQQQYQKRI
jgi:hypothetical protein